MARAAKSLQESRGENHIVENDIIVERSISKQHIEKLTRILADRRRGKIDAHGKPATALILDRATSPTMPDRMRGSRIAAIGASTLCSIAMARARSSIPRTSLADLIEDMQPLIHARAMMIFLG